MKKLIFLTLSTFTLLSASAQMCEHEPFFHELLLEAARAELSPRGAATGNFYHRHLHGEPQQAKRIYELITTDRCFKQCGGDFQESAMVLERLILDDGMSAKRAASLVMNDDELCPGL